MVLEGWKVVRLNELAAKQQSSFTNGPFGSNLLTSELRSSGVPVIYIRDIKDGFYKPKGTVYVDECKADELSACEVLPGDLLITKVGDPPAIASIYPDGLRRAIITQDVIRLRVDRDKSVPSFVRSLINSPLGHSLIEDIVIEGTRRRVSLGSFKQIKFLLPSLVEQKRISEILDSVDDAIAATQAVIDQTRKVKQGLLQQLLTRGIGHTKFKETAIGLIPESWHTKTIKELVVKKSNSLTAGPFGTIFKAKDFRVKGVPIVQIRHVTEDGFVWGNKTTYMDEEVYKIFHQPYTVRKGDLLITKMGEPPGVACIYPDSETFGMVTPDVIKATIDSDKADTYFMMCLYNSPPMKKCILELTKGGTRARITLDEFYKMLLPIPPLNEQIEISKVLSGLDAEIQSETKKLDRCEEVKRGLMQDLLTGRVRASAC